MSLLAGVGCKSGDAPGTGIIVYVDSNLVVPDEINQVKLTATSGSGKLLFERTDNLGAGTGRVALPWRVGMYPLDQGSEPIRIEAQGSLDGNLVVSRSATLSFSPGRKISVKLMLLAVCRGKRCSVAGQTCVASGTCEPDSVNSNDLPTYMSGQEPPNLPQPDASPADAGRQETGNDGLDAAAADRVATTDGAMDLMDGAVRIDGSTVYPDGSVVLAVDSAADAMAADLTVDAGIADASMDLPPVTIRTAVVTKTVTGIQTGTATTTLATTATATETYALPGTATATATGTMSFTTTATESATVAVPTTVTFTTSESRIITVSGTGTETATATVATTFTATATASTTVSQTATASGTVTVTSTATATAIGTNGSDNQDYLAMYYKLDQSTLDSCCKDSSTNGRTATSAEVTTSDGAPGPGSTISAHFNGRWSRILAPNFTADSATISAWVRPEAAADGVLHTLVFANNGVTPHYPAMFVDTDGSLGCRIYSFGTVKQPTALPPGQWTHAVCAVNADGVRLYQNGANPVSNTGSTLWATFGGGWSIGGPAQMMGSGYFKGDIDEVRIYGTLLSAAEIANLFTCNMLSCPNPLTVTVTATATATGSESHTLTQSATASQTITVTASGTDSTMVTRTATVTSTATGSVSVIATATETATATASFSTTATASASFTMTAYATTTVTGTRTATVSGTATGTQSFSFSTTRIATETATVTSTD